MGGCSLCTWAVLAKTATDGEILLQVGGIINLEEKNKVTSMCCNNNLE